MSLVEYRRKRHFQKTPEPQGRETESAGALQFVVQKHDASRLHYDFRLELDGVLKSWAVPKGPSLNPKDKRLAIMVEDHPFDYRNFEGTIPEGNYGAGAVIVWDKGTYCARESADLKQSEKLIRQGLAKGHLSIVLNGQKLKGEFSLLKLRRGEKNAWLLVKKNDRWASNTDVTKKKRSVLSGHGLDEIATGSSATPPKSKRKTKSTGDDEDTAPCEKIGKPVKPMLATLVKESFDRPGWLFEIKWDGYRAIAEVSRKHVSLYSRNHKSFDGKFAPIVQSLKKLKHEAILDGEVVVVDEAGKSSFQSLQNYQKTGQGRLCYYVFDLLHLDGRDLRGLPLRRRKEILGPILAGLPNVLLSEHVEDGGAAFFRAVQKQGLEGIVAKDGESPYREGQRGLSWLKIKTRQRQEAVIGGFTEPRGSRKGLGAVILGVFDGDELSYIGHTGGGSDSETPGDLRARLDPLVRRSCPFRTKPKTNSPAHWVEPRLVCEVAFQEWTQEGIMRQPIFLGLREDKSPKTVHREQVESVEKVLHEKDQAKPPKIKASASSAAHEPKLTNLSKVFWPEEGYTKGDLIDYYREVAPILLPYLHDRPESLNRHPNGSQGKNFFQKEVSNLGLPDWIATAKVPPASSGTKDITYLLCQDQATLLYLVNLGCIEINPWNSRVQSLDNPDYLVIDLDPVEVSFQRVVEAALAIRKLLDRLGAESVCKTSGKRGLHVFVPLGARYDNDQARRFAELVATDVHQHLPRFTSVVRSPALRRHRVYLDFLQNRRGQTLAAPYSVRPYPGATVSTPLKWQEVKKGLDPSRFTMKTIPKRLAKMGDLWQPILGAGFNLGPALDRLETASK